MPAGSLFIEWSSLGKTVVPFTQMLSGMTPGPVGVVTYFENGFPRKTSLSPLIDKYDSNPSAFITLKISAKICKKTFSRIKGYSSRHYDLVAAKTHGDDSSKTGWAETVPTGGRIPRMPGFMIKLGFSHLLFRISFTPSKHASAMAGLGAF